MAKTDPQIEAEKLFPGDRRKQDAYLKALGDPAPPAAARKRASTTKKTVRKTVSKTAARRRW